MAGHGAESNSTAIESTEEEFDPEGTLALILLYFGLLITMWVFIYFVEFLGNDLTVVG